MAKKTTKKDTKGKNTTKVEVSKKVDKKENVKKVEVKETNKTVVKKEKKNKKKGNFKSKVKALGSKIKTLFAKIIDNTPFAISLCIILLLVGALLFTVVSKRVPKTSEGKEIVATLNGKKITADELYESLKESYGTDSLINIIDTYIAEKEVKVTDDDKEYVQEVVDYYKEYAEYYGVDLATFLSSYMGLSGITTEDQFFDFVLEDYKKSLAVQNFVADEATEDELKEYYEENYSDKLTAKHILIEVDADAEDTEKAEEEAYNAAVKLIKKLDKVDADDLDDEFEELAKNNSDDTGTFENGGLIEDFTKKDVVEEFWNAAEKLKDGEYTAEPVKSTYGYHIILKVSSTPVEKYKDIKDEVKKAYAESLLSSDSTLSTTKWAELRDQYKLSIKDDFIKETYNTDIESAKKTDEEK
ncbi:MAG: peptidylprolyl isomerase [Bacilli bacterium]|nr:peptidylprolyl isomerase [Bacilli bacterium]